MNNQIRLLQIMAFSLAIIAIVLVSKFTSAKVIDGLFFMTVIFGIPLSISYLLVRSAKNIITRLILTVSIAFSWFITVALLNSNLWTQAHQHNLNDLFSSWEYVIMTVIGISLAFIAHVIIKDQILPRIETINK